MGNPVGNGPSGLELSGLHHETVVEVHSHRPHHVVHVVHRPHVVHVVIHVHVGVTIHGIVVHVHVWVGVHIVHLYSLVGLRLLELHLRNSGLILLGLRKCPRERLMEHLHLLILPHVLHHLLVLGLVVGNLVQIKGVQLDGHGCVPPGDGQHPIDQERWGCIERYPVNAGFKLSHCISS